MPRSAAISNAEARLTSRALVAVVGGTRPAVNSDHVGRLLEEFYTVLPEEYTVRRHDPEDFLVEFASQDIADRVLRTSLPAEAPFQLIWKRWRRQSMASFASFRFRVLVELKGIPMHARNVDTAQIILGSSCCCLVEAPPAVAGNDSRRFYVAGWCVHPDLVPTSKMIWIPEPTPQHHGYGLFLQPHEIIHSKQDGLWYLVHVRLVEVQDWNPDSDDDDTPPDCHGSSDDEDFPGSSQRRHGRPWPRTTRFNGAASGSEGPSLGPGWGPPFSSAATLGASGSVGGLSLPLFFGRRDLATKHADTEHGQAAAPAWASVPSPVAIPVTAPPGTAQHGHAASPVATRATVDDGALITFDAGAPVQPEAVDFADPMRAEAALGPPTVVTESCERRTLPDTAGLCRVDPQSPSVETFFFF